MPVPDLATLTLRGAIAGLDAGDFSVKELIRDTLLRIETTEPNLQAFVEVYQKDSIEHAIIADRARPFHRKRRPLVGLPIGVKDIFDVAGKHTRCNSRIRESVSVAPYDAEVVHRVRRDGAIFVGKTVTQEFAAGVVSTPCRNPWDLDRIPGGSSGGTAASVAIGTTLGGFGSDTGGSIRIPAALCGIVGLKPTWNQLPLTRVYPLAPSLDTVGPLARTVGDALVLYLSMADRTSEIDQLDEILAPAEVEKPLTGKKIGTIRSGYFTANLQPGIAESLAQALKVLEDLGAEVIEVEWDNAWAAQAVATLLSRVESGAVHHDHLRTNPELIQDDVRTRFEVGAILPADLYVRTQTARIAIRESIAALYREHELDAIVTPSIARTATPIDEPVLTLEDGSTTTVGVEMTRLTMPWNTTGQPVISVPCGYIDELPVGMSIVGKPNDELGISLIGHAYERATNWFAEGVALA